ncbi:uncharacterized protein N7518_001546 [Penicillium psychrosexuale]|uniref:uncharacterized protein n=1 Tax=Penicillium psychrosexuale TaxID=1002107 RepID=UPI00254579EA|nr:uncharacterized protein N7518_001546 [Penicillium psychrosexuale]KAJ5799478.1 hypothetical protein N7518_001546 [Penicillium psychrosexuale]
MTEIELSQRDAREESPLTSNGEGSSAPVKAAQAPKAGRKLPEWLDHFNTRDIKAIIAIKAAISARPAAETQAKLQALGQAAYSQANSTGQAVADV